MTFALTGEQPCDLVCSEPMQRLAKQIGRQGKAGDEDGALPYAPNSTDMRSAGSSAPTPTRHSNIANPGAVPDAEIGGLFSA